MNSKRSAHNPIHVVDAALQRHSQPALAPRPRQDPNFLKAEPEAASAVRRLRMLRLGLALWKTPPPGFAARDFQNINGYFVAVAS